MVQITYIEADDQETVVDANVGISLMEAAVRKNISSIIAECGGACACATCHIYVDPKWKTVTGEPTAMEAAMLDLAEGANADSRLSCQITITDEMHGLIVRVPAVQG